MARRQRHLTRSGLLPEAAHLVLPKGIVSDGFPSTRQVCERIGIIFDPWQVDLNRCLLSKAKGGLYAADTVLLSIPRQVGKTFDVGGVVFADSIIHPGTTTVWTAHRFKVARESFNEMRAWAKSPLLQPHIDYDAITTAAGNECIPFRNGSRIVFAARERGSIRGFTKVRRLILDEGQILTEHVLSDLAPTLNQAFNPQVVLMCTPPKPTDPSEVVTRLRADALAGVSEGVLYVEMSAPPGSDPDDRDAWKKANASYPKRTPAKAVLRLRKLLSEDDFMREALGVWDEAGGHVIDPAAWTACADRESHPAGPLVFSVAFSHDQSRAAVGLAGWRPDGLMHVEVADYRPGTSWAEPWLIDRHAQHEPLGVVVDDKGHEGTVIKGLESKRIPVMRPGAPGVAEGYADFVEDVMDSKVLRHRDQDDLNTALAGAVTRDVGDGGRAWGRRKSSADISPLTVVTNAAWGLRKLTAEGGGDPGAWAI